MSSIAHLQRYLAFRKGSVNRHGVHSPFVFDLIEKVLRKKQKEPVFDAIEKQRRVLLAEDSIVSHEDPGAGSSKLKSARKVKDIALLSLSNPNQCRILYRLVEYFRPQKILEFGSCLGISTAYMAAAGSSHLVSMEGHPDLYNLSKQTLENLNLTADVRKGLFRELLPDILNEWKCIDMAFVDGHHTEEATLAYFHQLLPYVQEASFLIFDDIHWSEGMESAWEQIKRHERVTLSVDLFWCGIVFFRKGLSGEHFKLRY